MNFSQIFPQIFSQIVKFFVKNFVKFSVSFQLKNTRSRKGGIICTRFLTFVCGESERAGDVFVKIIKI